MAEVATEMDLSRFIPMAITATVAIIVIIVAYVIGSYIISKIEQQTYTNTGSQLLASVRDPLSMTITFLAISVAAAIGIALVLYMYKGITKHVAPR